MWTEKHKPNRYFNSQPHEEADGTRIEHISRNHRISTHSLTRRLTYSGKCPLVKRDISTHSLTRRLTMIHQNIELRFVHFNSQPHEEADGGGILNCHRV